MASLKEILDDLEIDTSDLEDKNDENDVKLDEVKIEDIPEEQRPIFQKLLDERKDFGNEIAKRDLAIKTMRDFIPKDKEPEPKEKDVKKESIFGLDADDPYAPAFQKLADMIGGIQQKEVTDREDNFKSNLISFAQKNKDIVKYAEDMDFIRDQLKPNSPLRFDVPRLYELAKQNAERRANTNQDKVTDLNRQKKAKKLASESGGLSLDNTQDIVESKSIADAFDAAEKKLSSQ